MKTWITDLKKDEVLETKPGHFYVHLEVTSPTGEIFNCGRFIGKIFTPASFLMGVVELINFLTPGLTRHQERNNAKRR